mmetsp:Transcript_22708/g.32608  ORF Transcript_22708/g.32608 Transcript_22708/m.32608 type:complete len:350 (+) Transcript_22708:737-1786(+)
MGQFRHDQLISLITFLIMSVTFLCDVLRHKREIDRDSFDKFVFYFQASWRRKNTTVNNARYNFKHFITTIDDKYFGWWLINMWKSYISSAVVAITVVNISSLPLSHQDINEVSTDGISMPKYIQRYKVRIDSYSGKPVTSGRLEIVGGVPAFDNLLKSKLKFRLETLKKTLQCPLSEPDIDLFRGGIELWDSIKPTSSILESCCALLETKCHPWNRCQQLLPDFKQGKFPTTLNGYTGFFYWVKLFRITDGKLYYDWPWGVERFDPGNKAVITLLYYILDKVADIPDSAFFIGEQQSVSYRNFPFPSISCSPSFKSPELSLPWPESFKDALENYRHYVKHLNASGKESK